MTPQEVWLYFTRPYILLAAGVVLLSLPVAYRRVRIGMMRKKFRCAMCGNCCRFGIIELSPEDVLRIESKGYQGFYEKDGDTILIRKADGRCVFLENSLCSIHDFKPEVCRKFPFFLVFGVPYARGTYTCAGIIRLQKELGKK